MTNQGPFVPAARPDQVAAEDLRRSLRGPAIACMSVVVAFFGVFGVWAALAPISSAAVATGVVSPEGSRKTIQHLEGGIIKTLHVREGDVVRKGDLPSPSTRRWRAHRMRRFRCRLCGSAQ